MIDPTVPPKYEALPSFVFVFDESDNSLVFEFIDPCPSSLADLIASNITRDLVKGPTVWSNSTRRRLYEYTERFLRNLIKNKKLYRKDEKRWAYWHPVLKVELLPEERSSDN